MAELLAGYHRLVTPIQNIPVACTGQGLGLAVILLPTDLLSWTEGTSGIATSLAQTLPKPQPVHNVESG